MDARPCQIFEFFNGTKQLLVPLFQRPYEWKKEHWQTLWEDILERYERREADSATHFTGAIVTAPAKSVPVGVSKHLVIDGQQRLTTIAILICALRSCVEKESPRYRKLTRFLVNEDDDGYDFYKLLPTQVDRDAFFALINGENLTGNRFSEAHLFFLEKINGTDSEGEKIEIEKLIEILHSRITVVSIHLAEADDPYLIFESLNAKGAPLTQADLIRNYLLLRLHTQSQQDAYEKYWLPMQNVLHSEHLTEFLRHYLMTDGEEVTRSEVYSVLKRRLANIPDENVLSELRQMHENANYYAQLVGIRSCSSPEVDVGLSRLRRLDMTVANPLLLKLLFLESKRDASDSELGEIIAILESFIIRRMICRVPTNQLKRIFLWLAKNLPESGQKDYITKYLAEGNSGRRWPKDDEFKDLWVTNRIYSGTQDRCRLILETLESEMGHKEIVSFDNATIEHVMPQTLSTEWKQSLGEQFFSKTHDTWLDTIGNLTLTAYNPELSNSSFSKKKELLNESHYELNKYFRACDKWDAHEIQERAIHLFELARVIWKRPNN